MRIAALTLSLCLFVSSSLFGATAAEYGAQGKAALERREDQKAADLLAKAIALDPKNANYHYLLGGAYGRLALKANVLKYLGHKPVDSEPGHAETWYWIGQLQEKQGKRADAKASYTRALALAPGNKDVTDALKRVS
jgi:cytochrome c-type biogenesis protein CcmH/NrfG